MNGVKRRSTNQFDSLVVSQSFGYIVADTLNIDKSSMSFVAVIDIFLDTQLLQCQDTTDTQQDFLFQTVFPVATIKLMSNRTIELAIHFVVRIKQIQRNTTYVYSPYISMYIIVEIRYIDNYLLTVFIEHTVDRQLAEVLCLVIGNLLAVHRQCLSEIAITIEETYRAQVDIAVRSFLQIVAGQYTQTA